jgi:hypothetical protein
MIGWLRNIFSRKREEPRHESRIYSVGKPPPAKFARVPRNVPEPDPIYEDTGTLSLKDENVQDEANPYDTASWELDLEQGLRRVEDDKTVTRDRGKAEANNPYNTGAFRKGW